MSTMQHDHAATIEDERPLWIDHAADPPSWNVMFVAIGDGSPSWASHQFVADSFIALQLLELESA